MAYKILTSNPRRNTHHFFIDEAQDTQQLPKEPASTAFVAATGDTYICTNDKQWIKFNINKGCSSSNNNNNSQNQSDVNINDIIQELFDTQHMVEVSLNTNIYNTDISGYMLTYDNTSSPYFIGYYTDDGMIKIMAPINTTITLMYESKTLENYILCASYTGQDNGVEYHSVDYNFTSKITDYGTEISFKIPNTDSVEFLSDIIQQNAH